MPHDIYQPRRAVTIVGSSHFASRAQLDAYYKLLGNDDAEIQRKLDDGEVHLGRPANALFLNREGWWMCAL
jgi:hypothetical protein